MSKRKKIYKLVLKKKKKLFQRYKKHWYFKMVAWLRNLATM